MNNFFKFLLCFIVAFCGAVLTFLFSNDCCQGCVSGSLFAGVWSGLCASGAYEIGNNNVNKESLFSVAGGLCGGILGGILFAFAG